MRGTDRRVNLVLHATPEEVMRGVQSLQELGREWQVEERDLFSLALALEECGSNVVNHALRRDSELTFRVTIEHTGDSIVIELRDRGPEFDPTCVSAPGGLENDEDRPPGGFGIVLVRRSVDEIFYRREGVENVLRLTKIVDPSTRPG